MPGFGDPEARLLIVGLAPGAHGANRTGRVFTGDRSGDWLFRSLHRTGFANQPHSQHRHDGLRLSDAYINAVVRCAPPANRPTALERETCRYWLEREIGALPRISVVVCLGAIAFDQMLRVHADRAAPVPRPHPRFGHGVRVDLRPDGPLILASYHPSPQNTSTGRLTAEMLDEVFRSAARELA